MAVLNLPQLPSTAGSQHPEAAAGVLSTLAGLLHPYIQANLEQQKSQRAQTGLEQMLNPPVETPNAAPANEAQQAQTAIADQAPQTNALSSLLKPTAQEAPTQSTNEAPAPNMLEAKTAPTTPLQSVQTSSMQRPQPGSPGYTAVAAGQTPETYGQVASAQMSPKTLEQILAQKVSSGEVTPEEAFQMKNQWSMTPGKLAGRALMSGDTTALTNINQYQQGGKLPTATSIFANANTEANPQELNQRFLQQEKELASARGAGYAQARPITTVDANGKPVYGTVSDITAAKAEGKTLPVATLSPEVKAPLARAAAAGSQRAASVATAATVFAQEAPELDRLRQVVAAKNYLPSGGFTDINQVNQWLGMKTSDPDVNEFKKKTKLLADTLQRTVGGSQGGQWAFEVASDILDPSLDPEAFHRVLLSHQRTMYRMSDAYNEFSQGNLQGEAKAGAAAPNNAELGRPQVAAPQATPKSSGGFKPAF